MVALRTIVDLGDLDITVVHGHDGLDVELSGAHSSEQPDPTPWLSGGELLMSDGLGIAADADSQATYVEQLTRILDPDPARLEVRRNSEWLDAMGIEDVLRLAEVGVPAGRSRRI